MKAEDLNKILLVMFLMGQIIFPGALFSEAGPPNVITVKNAEEAEQWTPNSGRINSISSDRKEIVINDALYLLASSVKYYSDRRRPASPERFIIGTWVGFHLNDDEKIMSMQLTKPPENAESYSSEISAQPVKKENEKIYFENGVYKN